MALYEDHIPTSAGASYSEQFVFHNSCHLYVS